VSNASTDTRSPAADLLELQLDPKAPPGDLLPPLARLLRRLRDRERAQAPEPAAR
jgi:hypothetical protein